MGKTNDQQLRAQVAEEFLAQNYAFRENVLSGKVEYKDLGKDAEYKVFTKKSMNTISHRAKVEGLGCSKSDLEEVIYSDITSTHNPIQDYLNALPEWDGKDRVTNLWKRLGNVSDEMLDYLHIWHRSCVAHWLQKDTLHGNECVPTLIGAQGCGKTTFAKRLLPQELRVYFLDHLNLSNKFDKEMALTNNLLVNLDELEAIRPSQQAALKQTLSKSKVNGRPIYGGSQDDKPRFASFIATTNNQHPLQDATGSRRYLCVEIPDGCLVDNDTELDYQQLYAQLKHEVEVDNMPYWFTNDQTKRIQEINAPYMQATDLAEIISACFRKPGTDEQASSLTGKEIVGIIRQQYPSIQPSQAFSVHLGHTLRELGYQSKRGSSGMEYSIVTKKSA